MRGNRSLVFLGYVAVEAAALYWVWAAFGAVGVVSVLLGGFLLGMLVMRIAGIQAFSALTDAQRRAAAFGVTGADGSEQVVHSAGPTQADARETARRSASPRYCSWRVSSWPLRASCPTLRACC